MKPKIIPIIASLFHITIPSSAQVDITSDMADLIEIEFKEEISFQLTNALEDNAVMLVLNNAYTQETFHPNGVFPQPVNGSATAVINGSAVSIPGFANTMAEEFWNLNAPLASGLDPRDLFVVYAFDEFVRMNIGDTITLNPGSIFVDSNAEIPAPNNLFESVTVHLVAESFDLSLSGDSVLSIIPEPSSVLLVGLGALGFTVFRRRMHKVEPVGMRRGR